MSRAASTELPAFPPHAGVLGSTVPTRSHIPAQALFFLGTKEEKVQNKPCRQQHSIRKSSFLKGTGQTNSSVNIWGYNSASHHLLQHFQGFREPVIDSGHQPVETTGLISAVTELFLKVLLLGCQFPQAVWKMKCKNVQTLMEQKCAIATASSC